MTIGMAGWDGVVHGLRELDLNLRQFPEKLQRKALATAMRAGGRVIRDVARAQVPVKSGRLRRSIRVTIVRRGTNLVARIVAGRQVKKDDPFYAWMVEGGTKPHRIRAKMLAMGRAGALQLHGGRFVAEVDHPGAQAKPFLGPALQMGAEAAVLAMRDRLAQEIEAMGGTFEGLGGQVE